MYSVGDVVKSRSSFNNKTTFYIVTDKFINYFGDIVYHIETFHEDENQIMKFREIGKFTDWLSKAEDVTLF